MKFEDWLIEEYDMYYHDYHRLPFIAQCEIYEEWLYFYGEDVK